MKRQACAAVVVLFTPLAAVTFALICAGACGALMLKAALDIWTGE